MNGSTVVDAWDDNQPTAGASSSGISLVKKVVKPVAVRDDWEDDEEEEEDDADAAERNRRLWEDANAKESRPMPALIISRGPSATPATPNLPLNEPPTMRILKRPSPNTTSTSPTPSNNPGETLQEREARYQAARDRIFGTSTPSPAPESTPPGNASSVSTKVIREPRGPDNDKSDSKGFAERQTKRAPPPLES